MSERTSNASFFLLGALVGAAAAVLITPGGRQAFRRALASGLYEIGLLERGDHPGSDDESGAVEGGLAGTRSWSPRVEAGS